MLFIGNPKGRSRMISNNRVDTCNTWFECWSSPPRIVQTGAPVLLKQVCSQRGLWATTGDFLLRFLILNEIDICSEITWITPHCVPKNEISFVLKFPSFCSPRKTVWSLVIDLAWWNERHLPNFESLFCTSPLKKETNKPTNQKGPGFIYFICWDANRTTPFQS